MTARTPPFRQKEAFMWLFVTAVNDHVRRCRSAQFPDEHPICAEKCCPNCCDTCHALRQLRDHQDAQLTRLFNQHGDSLWVWQMADGSIDWSQIEAHWDASGGSCGREACIEATRVEMEAAADQLASRIIARFGP